ncbi:MAG: diaminopimelate decarboxylase [Candidatus Hydrogenedentes bacterium]|nr:diaminopimelate decarboxylase [Candidatus Hydrogenedentota bacterium]
MEELFFLSEDEVLYIQEKFSTPIFVYDRETMKKSANEVLSFPNAFGLTARFAMKALPTRKILQLFNSWGLHIDASSGWEVERALLAGIPPSHIQLTAQEIPKNLKELIDKGVLFNACSLSQLRTYGEMFPGTEVSVRINPGLGSGSSNRTNVGGPSSSFGIWYEYLDKVYEIANKLNLKITGLHTHIGSGSDPDIWVHCAHLALETACKMPEVTRLSLGGGYKVARMPDEKTANLQEIGKRILPDFLRFAEKFGRKLHLEIEPGTYLVARAGTLICSVIDVVNTGPRGYRFIKIDSGMTENVRPAMYGALHPLIVVPRNKKNSHKIDRFIVSGHCCESGDIFTPKRGDPEGLEPRELFEPQIGDALVVEGCGAYCASQSCKNYNSFPECGEILRLAPFEYEWIRKPQTLEQIIQNEI